MFHYLESRYSIREQQRVLDRQRRIPKKPRLFLNSIATIPYLQENDSVLVWVPDDLLISSAVDPSLHGKLVSFVQFTNSDFSECEIRFKNGDTCCVPSFCLRLEDTLLERKHRDIKNNNNSSPQKSDTDCSPREDKEEQMDCLNSWLSCRQLVKV